MKILHVCCDVMLRCYVACMKCFIGNHSTYHVKTTNVHVGIVLTYREIVYFSLTTNQCIKCYMYVVN